jgi:basic membrane protein A
VGAAVPGCGGSEDGSRAGRRVTGETTVGFLYVGSHGDYGYNQAAFEGSKAVRRAFPEATILQAENVAENAEAERVMEQMIDRGARIIFPTSLGHLQPALNVARRHPNVTFFQLGGNRSAANLGTYVGDMWEAQYLAGRAGGLATKTNRLGYVAAFPVPGALLNINAYALGARKVNPRATTTVMFTESWCDPPTQAEAARALLDRGVDVLTQHQDCTKTVIEVSERRGAFTTGYHFDAAELAPRGWLTGSVWNYGPIFADVVKTVRDGGLANSPYSGRYRGGLRDGSVRLARFGAAATPEIRKDIAWALEGVKNGTLQPFDGPIKDQAGRVRIPAGPSPDRARLKRTDFLVEGVHGTIPAQ